MAGRGRGDGLAARGPSASRRWKRASSRPSRSTSTSRRGRATSPSRTPRRCCSRTGCRRPRCTRRRRSCDSPQLAHRDAFEPLPTGDGRDAQVVGLPFRVVAGGDDATGAADVAARAAGARGEPRARGPARGLDPRRARRRGHEARGPAAVGHVPPARSVHRRRGRHGAVGVLRADEPLQGAAPRSTSTRDRDRLDALLADADVVLENLGPEARDGAGARRVDRAGRHTPTCSR